MSNENENIIIKQRPKYADLTAKLLVCYEFEDEKGYFENVDEAGEQNKKCTCADTTKANHGCMNFEKCL